MAEMWSTLIPLAVASALVPIQLIVTLVALRSSFRSAVAWVAGITAVRLAQGVLFGLVFSAGSATDSAEGPGPAATVLLLVFAVLFYVSALRKLIAGDDGEDAPPPKWMGKAESMTPLAAFGAGAGFIAIAAKFWVFTLGAISAISDADLGATTSVLAFLAFVVLAESGHLAILAIAALSGGSSPLLERVTSWLQRRSRVITIALGLVFGTWFFAKALSGLGIL